MSSRSKGPKLGRAVLLVLPLALSAGALLPHWDAPNVGSREVAPAAEPNDDSITNPFADDPAARVDGRRLFNWYNCSGCHGSHGGGGMGPSLRDSAWVYGGTDAAMYNTIAQGRARGMPAWESKVPRAQIWKMVAYLGSLGTPREPSPPPPPPKRPPVPEEARR